MRQSGGNGGLRRKESTKSVVRSGGAGNNADREAFNSAFFTPVPTNGSPTDQLVDRFSGMLFFFYKSPSVDFRYLRLRWV